MKLFAVTAPGTEAMAATELESQGAVEVRARSGGVDFTGDMSTVMRANLWCRIPSRILLRLAEFPVAHIAQLHKRSRDRVPWRELLPPHAAVRVRATCKKSPIYHSGAAAERVAKAIAEALGSPTQPDDKAAFCHQVLARIEGHRCTLSLDTSGEHLHKRGIKQYQGEAPVRETLAAAVLAFAGFRGECPLVDPMCGSGTFLLEAALISTRQAPGLHRGFAFEHFQAFDRAAWRTLRQEAQQQQRQPLHPIQGFDRDARAVARTQAMLQNSGLGHAVSVTCSTLSQLKAPAGPPGLMVCNPPYGERLGDSKSLSNLYASLGRHFHNGFRDWRLALLTSKERLARATGLKLAAKSAPWPHGGLKVRVFLYRPEKPSEPSYEGCLTAR